MEWGVYIAIFLTSTVKFLLAIPPAVVKLTYFETVIVTSAGGIAGVTFFYFSSSYFIRKAKEKRHKKDEAAKLLPNYQPPKKFTKFNKFVIRTKRRFGLFGIAFVTPSIISIPIGSIILARLYPHHRKKTVTLLYLLVIGWSFALTTFFKYIWEFIK